MPRARLIDMQAWQRRRRQQRAARKVRAYLRLLEDRLSARIAEQETIDRFDPRLVAIRADLKRGACALERLFQLGPEG